MSSLLISAAHKSSGKTTVTLGLCAAFTSRGHAVQPFKKGPDYIDPMWLGQAAGRPCHNLDFHTSTRDEILGAYTRHRSDADLAIVEGNKGLYDGLDLEGTNSNAALAKLLGIPVVLVIDAQGMTRGVAPLILGYQAFDSDIRIAGVILNKLGGSRHESKLRAVIEHYTDVPVLGAVHRQPDLEIVERHLGLMPSNEDAAAAARIAQIADVIGREVDVEAVLAVARTATSPTSTGMAAVARHHPDVRIGIARDAAFGFYYPGDLEALQDAGAELVAIDTLRESELPPVDGLFIGGGFPETHMRELERNTALRAAIAAAIEAGLPTYAECGGLMYLSRSLRWKDQRCEMVGVIAADTVLHERPQGRGYVRLRPTGKAPWSARGETSAPAEIRAHEFHYSTLVDADTSFEYAYEVTRGTGIDGRNDGIVYKNLVASYAHLRDTEQSPWAANFVAFVRAHRNRGRPMSGSDEQAHENPSTPSSIRGATLT